MNNFWQWTEAYYRNKKQCPYWGDGGSGVVPLARNTGRYLINMRGQDVNEGGTYGVFGGGIFLDQTPYKSIEELARTDYPKRNALNELHEETGHGGEMDCVEVYVYKDNKFNAKGEPCNFYYWNYVGLCPVEFPVSPNVDHSWENGEGSGWYTFEELFDLRPLHFGLKSVFDNAKTKLEQMVHKLGFQGNEKYPHQVISNKG